MEREWKTIDPGKWTPKQDGELIEGILVQMQPKQAELSARYTLDTENGLMLVWGSTVLDNRMSYVKIGQHVRITFKGATKNKKGQPLKIFKVEIAADTGDIDEEII